jgi:hypothetical protein
MMMRSSRPATIFALLLAACGGAGESADPPRRADSARAMGSAPAADSVQPAPPATVEDAVDAAPPPAPVAAPQDTMLTAWRALEFPSEPWEQSAATPRALLRRVRDVVAAQLEEPDASVLPTRMESQAADSAVGVLVHPDQADDSVRDVEFRLRMRRQGSGWSVVGVDRRERCRRGVAAGGLCA